MAHKITAQMINGLLTDAALSHKLSCAGDILYRNVGFPTKFGDSELSQTNLGFTLKESLLKGVYINEEDALSIPSLIKTTNRKEYLVGLNLSIGASIADWCKKGKLVHLASHITPASHQTLLPMEAIPHGTTAVWFETSLMGKTTDINHENVTANLVFVCRKGGVVTFRVFVNPESYNGKPVASYSDEKYLEDCVSGAKKNLIRNERVNVRGKNLLVSKDFTRALDWIDRTSTKLGARYPFGVPGSMATAWDEGSKTWYWSHEGGDSNIVVVALQHVIGLLQTNMLFDENQHQIERTEESDSIPRRIQSTYTNILDPSDIFAITRVRYNRDRSSHSIHDSNHQTNTGRRVTVEHTRCEHLRTLRRGQPNEKVVYVKSAHVTPKPHAGVAPGTLIVPRRKRIKPGEGA